jgi:hypothetical protein
MKGSYAFASVAKKREAALFMETPFAGAVIPATALNLIKTTGIRL